MKICGIKMYALCTSGRHESADKMRYKPFEFEFAWPERRRRQYQFCFAIFFSAFGRRSTLRPRASVQSAMCTLFVCSFNSLSYRWPKGSNCAYICKMNLSECSFALILLTLSSFQAFYLCVCVCVRADGKQKVEWKHSFHRSHGGFCSLKMKE